MCEQRRHMAVYMDATSNPRGSHMSFKRKELTFSVWIFSLGGKPFFSFSVWTFHQLGIYTKSKVNQIRDIFGNIFTFANHLCLAPMTTCFDCCTLLHCRCQPSNGLSSFDITLSSFGNGKKLLFLLLLKSSLFFQFFVFCLSAE